MPYDNNNVFAKILRNEASCIKVYEDELTMAFMDIMPQTQGHTLVIPKETATTIYELSDTATLACMKTIKKIGKAIETALEIKGSSVFQHNGKVAGQTVPHCHFHVLPGSLSNLKEHATNAATTEDIEAIAEKIKACL